MLEMIRKLNEKAVIIAAVVSLVLVGCASEPSYAVTYLGDDGPVDASPGGDVKKPASIFKRTTDDDDSEDSGLGGFEVGDEHGAGYQLTDDDIQKMNDNKAVIVRNNQGHVSTLVGYYYDTKIHVVPGDISTFEEAIDSLNGLATMLGLRSGTEFIAYEGSQDKQGYTYLTYQQKDAGNSVMNATMHIVVDPDGYCCAVSSSFTPDFGFENYGNAISAQQAVEIVRNFAYQCGYPNLYVYEDATMLAPISIQTQIHRCYVVFTENPEGVDGFENLRYYKWYVANDDSAEQPILMLLPSSTLSASVETSYMPTEEYFEDLEPVVWSGDLNLFNDGYKHVEITVARNTNNGLYYMIDPTRRIAVAECYDFMYGGGLNFLSNSSNTWEERDLAAMYDYEAAYDAYGKIGIYSPDGYHTPILLLRNYCDENRQPVNNACFMGQFNGWFTFCYSTANNWIYDLDVVGHEYTHAVTESCIMGSNYYNDAGAINEAYSDIMGNLIEYMAGRTQDPLWLNGENSNEAIRQMSDPLKFHQPDSIGGPYYVPNVSFPVSGFNDNGGVHTNSGIVNYAAYRMYTSGLDYETMFRLFYTSMNILTPANGFGDVYASLIYAARAMGREDLEKPINDAFSYAGVLSDRDEAEMTNYLRDGYGTFRFNVMDFSSNLYAINAYDGYTQDHVATFWPNDEGTVMMTMVAGYYYIELGCLDVYSGTASYYYFDGNTWGSQPTVVSLPGGGLTMIADVKNY